MEPTELLDDVYADDGMVINQEIKEYLKTTAGWGLFLAIMGLIVAALMILGGIFFAITIFAVEPMADDFPSALPMTFLALIYPLLGFVYLYPSLKLLNFSNGIKSAIQNNSNPEMTKAFRNLKSMFKFMGISIIVSFAFYFLLIFGMLAFGVSNFI